MKQYRQSVKISYIEIVDPADFLNDPFLDNIEVNNYNVKNLIMVAYRRLNIEQLT
ncbi:hypothetical protein CANFE04_00970 [Ligilactobacillus animalis]